MTLRFTPQALADLESLHAYIALRQSPTGAYTVVSVIRTALNRLTVFPDMGRVGRVDGTRELVVPRLPYVVVYLIQNEDVIVQRVLHASQQWPPGDDEEQG